MKQQKIINAAHHNPVSRYRTGTRILPGRPVQLAAIPRGLSLSLVAHATPIAHGLFISRKQVLLCRCESGDRPYLHTHTPVQGSRP